MPRLLLFAPCHRVSYDANDQSASLISLFQGFTVSAAPIPGRFPSGEVANIEIGIPLRWAIFTLLRKAAEDDGKKFIQTCDLTKPSGKKIELGAVSFEVKQQFHRVTLNITNFPVDESGDYILRMQIRADGETENVISCEYPVSVTHSPSPRQEPAIKT